MTDKSLAVRYVPAGSLIAYSANSRTHTPAQIEKICRSLREFGWTNPILLDGKNGVIAGHARLAAAQKLGITEVPTIDLAWLSTEQKRAYVIADNRLAEEAGWDKDLLRTELGDLQELGFELSLTGFDDIQIGAILAESTSDGNTDPDDAPGLPENPVSVPGDLWILDRHRILCGDSTVATDVERVLDGVKPHLMVTDPPYGVNYDPSWRVGTLNIKGGAMGKVENDGRADWRESWALFPGTVAYVWHGGLHAHEVAESLEAAGFALRSQIIWDKTRMVIGRGDYHWRHEPCWYAVRKGAPGQWAGDRKQTTVWPIAHMKSETGHGTQKPVECMMRPMLNNSSPGQAVYEPFSGSGTTIIAAERSGRSCMAIELNSQYVDVAVERWQSFTGREAHLEGDGRSFAEVKAARAGGSVE